MLPFHEPAIILGYIAFAGVLITVEIAQEDVGECVEDRRRE